MRFDKTYTKFFERDFFITTYLNNIAQYTPPTPERENQLVKDVQNGNEEALSELVMGHQRIIFAMAKKYAKNKSELIDYVNEGTIGLITAIEKYDETHGVRFITYASHYIRRQMNEYLTFNRDQVDITNRRRFGGKLKQIKRECFNQTGVLPSNEEIITLFKERYNINIKNIADIYDVKMHTINIDKDDDNFDSDVDDRFNNATSQSNDYNNTIEDDHIKYIITNALTKLNEKDADIIKMSYGIGEYDREYSIEDIAYKYNISSSAMRTRKMKIIDKLKKFLITKNVA